MHSLIDDGQGNYRLAKGHERFAEQETTPSPTRRTRCARSCATRTRWAGI